MARQSERTARTRELLICAAADRFVQQGFAQTSLDEVVADAGVSKGALYHHFAGKAELLEAVFESISREAVAKAAAAAVGLDSPRAALAASLKAWLRASQEDRCRTVLLDLGPAVLGFRQARLIEQSISEALILKSIERTVAVGEAECADPHLTAKLINAAVTELALTASDQSGAAMWMRLDNAIDRLLLAMLPSAGSA